ncbi:unnamed protein product [Spirodela intermedia]|uniref:E2 ubiquitin-conjugating enzyme n=1 Tax=Spirodela intermedia TaxID=51605 RepID=A0A7I8J7K7_SPIIN|nr:unnamed protein product [Spirodela intermedia]CAA6665715.1 unnamed protein product [Spirodela intermedia]
MNMLYSDSDWESYSGNSDNEDQYSNESVFGGHARSILSSLDASIRKIDDFLSLDRGFVRGEFVSSVSDQSGQIGRVVNVDMIVELEDGYGEAIKDVDGKIILSICSFSVGDYVIHGPWLGRVDKVCDVVTVLFDDGAKCQICTEDPENLMLLSANALEDAPFPYYPGQRVKMRRSTLFDSARWLCDAWNGSQDEGTVCKTEVGLIHVNWLASVVAACNLTSAPPPVQDPKDLTLLSCYSHTTWQPGDWCKLPHDFFQNLQTGMQEHISQGFNPRCSRKMQKVGMKDIACDHAYVIAKTRTKLDISWQDGSHSEGVDPGTLFPVNNVGDQDFWPEQIVLEKAISEDGRVSSNQRLGVVKYVDAKERTVKVRWIPDLDNSDGLNSDFVEETVSAYELVEHPDYNYRLGDIVFRHLLRYDHLEENFHATQPDRQTKMHEVSPSYSKPMVNFHGDYSSRYLSCIGNVVGFKDGDIEVRWASGIQSKAKPSEVYGLDKLATASATPENSSEVTDENEQDRQPWNGKERDLPGNCVYGSLEDSRKRLWDVQFDFLTRAAIGLLSNVATVLVGYHGSLSLSSTKMPGRINDRDESWKLSLEPSASQINEKPEYRLIHPEDVTQHDEILQQTSLENQVSDGVHGTLVESASSAKADWLEQFGFANDYSDHHFIDGVSSQVRSSWLKKIQQEWNILEKNLPETIYVRVYEERMDLMRAAIIGTPGTPYHDGLFFFDICFPPDYPHEPPLVHYHSGGLRLNPNLYESGKVCLSLLKTWTGTESEVWNPEGSTILQVLLSLQALVLNDKPYFNEAGYDRQVGKADGERNAVTYNENAFLLSCKSMLFLLKNPQSFETFVVEHFARRSQQILLACKAYMDGAAQVAAPPEAAGSSSTGFKIMLTKLFPKLVSAFAEVSADCSPWLDGGGGGGGAIDLVKQQSGE